MNHYIVNVSNMTIITAGSSPGASVGEIQPMAVDQSVLDQMESN